MRNDPLTTDQHLLMSVLDGVNFLNFQMYYVAAAQIGKDYKKIWSKGPKPIERPKYDKPKEEKEKKIFTSTSSLMDLVSKPKVNVIEHTTTCISSRINDGGGEIRCSCPERQPKGGSN